MCQQSVRSAWMEIDLKGIAHNINAIKEKVGGADKVMAVIKANACGLGAVKIANELKKSGISSFAVATPLEALTLREHGIEDSILVLGVIPKNSAGRMVNRNIDTIICTKEHAQTISEAAKKLGTVANVYIKADTGMGRIGYITYTDEEIKEAVEEITEIVKLPNLKIKGVFSHFSTADEADKEYSNLQRERFANFCDALEKAGVEIENKLLSNSAATIEIPEAYYDIVRPGIILYGYYPSDEVKKELIDLKPTVTIKSKIAHIKTLPAGSAVGYGRKYVAEEERVIATLPIGYADGYPRPYSQYGRVIVNGHYAPVRGNICMDQCMIDITGIPNVNVCDDVIIVGTDGELSVTPEELAKACGTINYEILCNFGLRLEKLYIE